MAWFEDEEFPEWFPFSRRRRLWRWLFRDIEEFEREFERMFEEMTKEVPKELIEERELPGGGRYRRIGPFVYGFSMTVGPEGKPIIREFGNVRPARGIEPLGRGRPGLEIKEAREPLVDVFQEDDTIKVIAELPGVEKDDIKLEATKDTLVISVETPQRKYYKAVNLPSEVEPDISKASYKNGVLEVTLRARGKPKGRPIKIE